MEIVEGIEVPKEENDDVLDETSGESLFFYTLDKKLFKNN